MKIVNHKQVDFKAPQGGSINTTLCGRVRNGLADGYNVADEVTCKFCLKVLSDPKSWQYRKWQQFGTNFKERGAI